MSRRKRRVREPEGEEGVKKQRGSTVVDGRSRTSRRGEALMTAARIRQMADLSRLTMDPSEEEELVGELSSILEYFRVIDKAGRASESGQRTAEQAEDLRADEARPSDPDALLRGVPQRKGRFVKAPRVF